MRYIFFIVCMCLATLSKAQSECNCQKNFTEIYQKVTDNYAAFDMKVNLKTKPVYDELTKKVREKAKGVTDPKACLGILNEWLEFFKDGHLFINTMTSIDNSEPISVITERAGKVGMQKFVSEPEFQAYLYEKEATLDDIEGIWESDDKGYRLGIVRDGLNSNKFFGFLLAKRDHLWVFGKNKFELEKISPNRFKTKYYYADFSSENTLTRQVKNMISIDNIFKMVKHSAKNKELASQYELDHQMSDYRVEKIDADNTLLVLPPFTIPNAPTYIRELVNQNSDLIRSSKNLIIDFRNNSGGDENAFDAVFPFIANGPIVRKGSKIRATQENLILLNHELKAIQDYPQYKDNLDPKLREITKKMQFNMGRMFDGPDKTFEFEPNTLNPKKVVILVNKNTASAAESLCLEAKQSPKTILMGTNTKGFADYTEVRDWGLPCFGWRLAVALGISYRLPERPIENIGIKPDVMLSEDEPDWVSAAVKYLNSSK